MLIPLCMPGAETSTRQHPLIVVIPNSSISFWKPIIATVRWRVKSKTNTYIGLQTTNRFRIGTFLLIRLKYICYDMGQDLREGLGAPMCAVHVFRNAFISHAPLHAGLQSGISNASAGTRTKTTFGNAPFIQNRKLGVDNS